MEWRITSLSFLLFFFIDYIIFEAIFSLGKLSCQKRLPKNLEGECWCLNIFSTEKEERTCIYYYGTIIEYISSQFFFCVCLSNDTYDGSFLVYIFIFTNFSHPTIFSKWKFQNYGRLEQERDDQFSLKNYEQKWGIIVHDFFNLN